MKRSIPLLVLLLVLPLTSCGRSEPATAIAQRLGDAVWVWAPGLAKAPAAALLARDFELEATPGEASLVLRAGDGWIAWVNGHRVAALETGGACDLAEVDLIPYLRAGVNRVALEVRFEGRVGGAIGCVRVDGQCEVPTDSRWRVEPGAGSEVLQGWVQLGESAAEEIAPQTLATSCLVVRTEPGLVCGDTAVDLPIVWGEEGEAKLDLPAAGRLELVLAPPREDSTIRIDSGVDPPLDAMVLAGSEAFLELAARDPGSIEVHGVAVVGAVLWPWNDRCGSFADQDRPRTPASLGGIKVRS